MSKEEMERMQNNVAIMMWDLIARGRHTVAYNEDCFEEKCREFFNKKNSPEMQQLLTNIDTANILFNEAWNSNCHSFSEYISWWENHIWTTLYTWWIRHRNYKTVNECKDDGWQDLKIDRNWYFPDELDDLQDTVWVPCEWFLLHHEDWHSFIVLWKMGDDYMIYEQPWYNETPRFMFYRTMRGLYSWKLFFRPLRLEKDSSN